MTTDNAYLDCRGNAHPSDEVRHLVDVQSATDMLDEFDKWVCEYHTGNSDYPDGFSHIVSECSHEWADRIRDWLDKQGTPDWSNKTVDYIIDSICARLDDFDWEPEYSRNEYDAYHGSGCCLLSIDIGEVEEQVEVNAFPELKALHESGRLDDVLDDVKSDTFVCRDRRRVKNEETGLFEYVGRESYFHGGHHADAPYFYTNHSVPGQWHFVVSEENMDRLLCAAVVEYCRRAN